MTQTFKSEYKTESESFEQIQLFAWAQWLGGKYPELSLMYHIPNEGKRSKTTGSKLKKEGLKAGVPDICLPVPRGRYHGLYIEMKATGNKLTDSQAQWLEMLDKQDYYTAVCYGWEIASKVITKYLNIKETE